MNIKKSLFNITILTVLVVLFSCKETTSSQKLNSQESSQECDLPDYPEVRKNKLPLNKQALESLQIITNILDSAPNLVSILDNPDIAKYVKSEVFFNLSEESETMHFKHSFYDEHYRLSHYINYDIELSDFSVESIKTSVRTDDNWFGSMGYVDFTSKFNNPDAVLLKFVNNYNGEFKVTQCERRSYFSLWVKADEAEMLKAAFIDFLGNID